MYRGNIHRIKSVNFVECNGYCGIKFSGCLLQQSKFGFVRLVYKADLLTNFEYKAIQRMIKILYFFLWFCHLI